MKERQLVDKYLCSLVPTGLHPVVPSDHQLDDTLFWLLFLPSFTSLPPACIRRTPKDCFLEATSSMN